MTKPGVLVVEDEFIVAYELKTALEDMGFSVCGMVSTGEEAIEMAERHHPDCVLMDVSLKGELDGIEAARCIRSRFGIRTAFLSGFPAQETLDSATGIDPVACFVKPLEYDQLEAALRLFFQSVYGMVH
jgi:DNA-binding NarL/FixJ family response regulator